MRPTATPAQLIADAHMPDQPADVLRNVAATRTQKTPSSAATPAAGVTFTYHAGPHLALDQVRLQLIPADEVTDPAGEVHTMRHVQDGVFAVRVPMAATEARKTYRWRVLADVSGGDVRGNPRARQDERVTFGPQDPRFTVQDSDSTVRYSAVTYDRMGAVLQDDGRLSMRVHAPDALRVALKVWDRDGVAQRIPLQRESPPAAQRSAPARAPAGQRSLPPPPLSPAAGEGRPTWTAQLSPEASAALVGRPYLIEIDDKEVTDPFARAVTDLPRGSDTRRAAQVVGPAHVFENDAVPREHDARAWVTCRVDLSALQAEPQPQPALAAGQEPLPEQKKVPGLLFQKGGLAPFSRAGAPAQAEARKEPQTAEPGASARPGDQRHGTEAAPSPEQKKVPGLLFEQAEAPAKAGPEAELPARVAAQKVDSDAPVQPSEQSPAASPLARLRDELPALVSLGITTLELDGLTPKDALGARVQRNLAIDPQLGTPRELQALVDAAHGQGLNVVLGTQYDANAADRPADADFVRNHAVYQLDAFHADGLRVAVSRGDAPADGAQGLQIAEMTRQLGCLRTHVLGDDALAASNLARAALDAGNRPDLEALQASLGIRRPGALAADAVGAPALPAERLPMTPGQARMAVAMGLLTASDACLFDAYDLGGFTWTPRQHGLADRAVRALARDIPLDDLRFNQDLRKKLEHLLTLTQQARQADPLYRGLGLTERLVLALLSALTPAASRRVMDDLARRHMDRFAQDMVRLRKRWPGLFDAEPPRTEALREHADTGVLVTAHGGRFVVVAHTGDETHDTYSVPLPPGRWQRVLHSEAQRYGGSEPNPEATPSVRGGLPRPMRLLPRSVQIFECVDT